MKKIMLIAAIACMALVSCTKEELEPNANEANAISFSAYSGRNVNGTKAETNLTALQTAGFNLMAFYTGTSLFDEVLATATPNYMYNEDAHYETSTWSYSPVKYWPNATDDKISFFAYMTTACVSGTSANTAKGYPTVTFAQDANCSTDFVVAITKNQEKTANAVKLPFKHTLTRAMFSAKVSAAVSTESKVFITDMKVDGSAPEFATGGTFTFSNAENYGSWSNLTNPTNFQFVLNKKPNNNGSYSSSSVALPQNATVISLVGNDTDNYMYLVPTANGLTNALSIIISYDIVTVDDKVSGGYTIAHNTASASISAGTLKQGYSYAIEFTVDMETIKVTAESVEAWL